jgi:pimeloyl-ACP methyl ester carboxylesterase
MILHSKIEGNGKPLVIIHGFLGSLDNWKSLAMQYAANGFEVHSLDLRNHGKSFHSDIFTYEVMALDILEYCKKNHLKNVNIIGHSMGGKVAMLFAVQNPDLVDKLLVADIGPKYYKPHHDEILNGLSAVNFSQKPSRTEIDETLKLHIADFETRQFLMKSLYWKETDQLEFRFNLPVFQKNKDSIGEALHDDALFTKSVLFLRGGESGYIKDTEFEEIKKQFPLAELKTIPNAGHWLHAENPKLFFEFSMEFFCRLTNKN